MYRIFMEELDDLPEGWLKGGCRTNDYIYCRTPHKSEATKYDIHTAMLEQQEATSYGYPASIVPEPTAEQYKAFITQT